MTRNSRLSPYLIPIAGALILFSGSVGAQSVESESTGTSVDGVRTKAVVLGDSMSLCGFGDTLTEYLHASGMLDEVHMYMASGTNPLSWLSLKSYQRSGTRSGYWEIHQTASGREQVKDVYGMRRGYRPGYHRVPKLDKLLDQHTPDVLIVQLGSNLYDLFPTKTVTDENGKRLRQRCVTANGLKALPGYLKPFRQAVIESGATLKHCCWITPPACERVHTELADAVVQAIRDELSPLFEVFDSRDVTSYPYKNIGSDGIHFWGTEATMWGADTFAHLECTLPQKHEYSSLPLILDRLEAEPVIATSHALEKPAEAETLKLLLRHRPEIIPLESMHPYRNQIAVFDYQVIGKGGALGRKMRVVHPVVLDLQLTKVVSHVPGTVITGQFQAFDATSSPATWPRSDDYDFATLDEDSLQEFISVADLELIAKAESEKGVLLKEGVDVDNIPAKGVAGDAR